MTGMITVEEAGKLAHKYRFANNDLERVLCETARTVIALHAQLADAQAAQAMVLERMTGVYDRDGRMICVGDRIRIDLKSPHTKTEYWYPEYEVVFKAPQFELRHVGGDKDSDTARWYFRVPQPSSTAKIETIRALAPIDGLALVRELRDRVEKAEAGEDKWMNRCMEEVGQHLETKADRDRLAAANAALEAKVAGLRDFVDDFAKAKIDALRYSPPYGSSPEDEPDPVVDAKTVWAWQADAKAALATQEAGNG